MSLPPTVSVAGAGAAGTALARALVRHAGLAPGEIACRDARRAAERAALVGGGEPLDLEAMANPARPPGRDPVLLLVAVPDRVIAEVAARLAARPWPADSVALHLSGSVDVDALAPLQAAGLSIGGLHPLRSFVDAERDADELAGTVFALEGRDDRARAAAEAIASALGGQPLLLAPGARAAWHAGATHAANHLVALVDQALDLLEAAGLERDAGRAALGPLLASTLRNLAAHSPERALTGPVVRGDVQAVERHLQALEHAAPDVTAAYLALARRAVSLAVRRGLEEPVAARLRRLLEERA